MNVTYNYETSATALKQCSRAHNSGITANTDQIKHFNDSINCL